MGESAVDAAATRALQGWLRPLAEFDAALPGLLADYVVTGNSSEALGSVVGERMPHSLELLTGYGYQEGARASLALFCKAVPDLPVEVVLRWAEILGQALTQFAHVVAFDSVDGLSWPEALVILGSSETGRDGLDHPKLEELLTAAGSHPASLLLAGFRAPRNGSAYHFNYRQAELQTLNGYKEAVERNLDAIKSGLDLDKVADQQAMLPMVAPLPPGLQTAFAAQIAHCATSSSRAVRTAADPLTGTEGVPGELRRIAVEGQPEQRLHALKLLWATNDPGEQQWATEQAAADRAASVRALTDQWQQSAATEPTPVEVPVIDWTGGLTDDLRARLRSMWAKGDDELRRRHSRHSPQHGLQPPAPARTLDPDDLQQVLAALEAGKPVEVGRRSDLTEHDLQFTFIEFGSKLGTVALTAVLARLGLLVSHADTLTTLASRHYAHQLDRANGLSLLELVLLLDGYGLDGAGLVLDKYSRHYEGLGRYLPDEAVAPFVLHALPRVLELLQTATGNWYYDSDSPYRALATLPLLPAVAVDALFAVALGVRKSDRGRRRTRWPMSPASRTE